MDTIYGPVSALVISILGRSTTPTAPLQGEKLELIGIVRRDGKKSDDVTLIAWSRVKQALFTPLDTLPPRTDTVALTLTLTDT